jgi:hypothetical protein
LLPLLLLLLLPLLFGAASVIGSSHTENVGAGRSDSSMPPMTS